jgi:hypothetical protein
MISSAEIEWREGKAMLGSEGTTLSIGPFSADDTDISRRRKKQKKTNYC